MKAKWKIHQWDFVEYISTIVTALKLTHIAIVAWYSSKSSGVIDNIQNDCIPLR